MRGFPARTDRSRRPSHGCQAATPGRETAPPNVFLSPERQVEHAGLVLQIGLLDHMPGNDRTIVGLNRLSTSMKGADQRTTTVRGSAVRTSSMRSRVVRFWMWTSRSRLKRTAKARSSEVYGVPSCQSTFGRKCQVVSIVLSGNSTQLPL